MACSLSREMITPEVEARFWSKVERGEDDACWPWAATILPNGYGSFYVSGLRVGPHRIALLLSTGEQTGEIARHRCDNRICCNPAHLVWGSVADNNRDMWERGRQGGIVAANPHKTHCPQGHPYEGPNLFLDAHGRRNCRTCWNDRMRLRMRAKRAADKAAKEAAHV